MFTLLVVFVHQFRRTNFLDATLWADESYEIRAAHSQTFVVAQLIAFLQMHTSHHRVSVSHIRLLDHSSKSCFVPLA